MKIAMKILGGLIAYVLMLIVVFGIIHLLGGYEFDDILTAFGWICGVGTSMFIVAMIFIAVFWDDKDYYG